MVKLLSTITLYLALILFPPSVLALVSNNAVAGDLTYPIKRSLESVIVAVASVNPTTKAWFSQTRSNRRYKEFTTLIAQGKNTTETLNELAEQTDVALEQIAKVTNPEEKAKLIEQLSQSIKKYDTGLQQYSNPSTEAPAAIAQVPVNNTDNTAQNQTVSQSEPVSQPEQAEQAPAPTPTPAIGAAARRAATVQQTPVPTTTPQPTSAAIAKATPKPTTTPQPTSKPTTQPTAKPQVTSQPTSTAQPTAKPQVTARPTATAKPKHEDSEAEKKKKKEIEETRRKLEETNRRLEEERKRLEEEKKKKEERKQERQEKQTNRKQNSVKSSEEEKTESVTTESQTEEN